MSWEEFGEQESAGGITDYEITVTNAFFAIDEKYSEKVGSDVFFLHWEGVTGVPGHEQMLRDGFHPKWATDPDWVSMDGGATIKSQSGKSKLGKAAGRMCVVAFASVGEAGVKKGDPQSPFNNGTPRDAAVWIGSKWFMQDVTRDFGNGMKSTDTMPVKYLGLASVAAAPVAAAPTPVATTPAPAPAPVAAAPAPTAAPGLRDQIVGLARSIDNHSAFVSAAMAIPGVSADAALVGEIVSPAGLWAQAQG